MSVSLWLLRNVFSRIHYCILKCLKDWDLLTASLTGPLSDSLSWSQSKHELHGTWSFPVSLCSLIWNMKLRKYIPVPVQVMVFKQHWSRAEYCPKVSNHQTVRILNSTLELFFSIYYQFSISIITFCWQIYILIDPSFLQVTDLVFLTDNTYKVNQVFTMERIVLRKFGFDLNSTDPVSTMEHFLQIANADRMVRASIKYFICFQFKWSDWLKYCRFLIKHEKLHFSIKWRKAFLADF